MQLKVRTIKPKQIRVKVVCPADEKEEFSQFLRAYTEGTLPLEIARAIIANGCIVNHGPLRSPNSDEYYWDFYVNTYQKQGY